MASAITHAAIGASIGLLASSVGPQRKDRRVRLWLWAAAFAVLPDADVAMHLWVSYGHWLGHRGFFHSPFFYLCLSGAVAVGLKPRILVAVSLFTALLSHSILDAMTDGGLGVAFLAPFEAGRYFFAWRPIPVSPLSVTAFFGEWGVRVLAVELCFALPALLVAAAARWFASNKQTF